MSFRWDETADPYAEAARIGALRLARSVELRQRQSEMASGKGPPETAGVALLGRYLRRSRLLAEMTQQQLADAAGVSQSMVSRAERGAAPGMEVARLLRLIQPLARMFPLGACPHDHNCAWQPVRPIDDSISDPTLFITQLLRTSGET